MQTLDPRKYGYTGSSVGLFVPQATTSILVPDGWHIVPPGQLVDGEHMVIDWLSNGWIPAVTPQCRPFIGMAIPADWSVVIERDAPVEMQAEDEQPASMASIGAAPTQRRWSACGHTRGLETRCPVCAVFGHVVTS